jgi:hypothetical protein
MVLVLILQLMVIVQILQKVQTEKKLLLTPLKLPTPPRKQQQKMHLRR